MRRADSIQWVNVGNGGADRIGHKLIFQTDFSFLFFLGGGE